MSTVIGNCFAASEFANDDNIGTIYIKIKNMFSFANIFADEDDIGKRELTDNKGISYNSIFDESFKLIKNRSDINTIEGTTLIEELVKNIGRKIIEITGVYKDFAIKRVNIKNNTLIMISLKEYRKKETI